MDRGFSSEEDDFFDLFRLSIPYFIFDLLEAKLRTDIPASGIIAKTAIIIAKMGDIQNTGPIFHII